MHCTCPGDPRSPCGGSTTFITCPADPKETLGIKLPFLVMIIKNLKKYFTFEVQVRCCSGGWEVVGRRLWRWWRSCCVCLMPCFGVSHPHSMHVASDSCVRAGAGRQERAAALPGQQLPVEHARQALHLHHAHASGRRLEPDPVQPQRLHASRIRHQLHRDLTRSGFLHLHHLSLAIPLPPFSILLLHFIDIVPILLFL